MFIVRNTAPTPGGRPKSTEARFSPTPTGRSCDRAAGDGGQVRPFGVGVGAGVLIPGDGASGCLLGGDGQAGAGVERLPPGGGFLQVGEEPVGQRPGGEGPAVLAAG